MTAPSKVSRLLSVLTGIYGLVDPKTKRPHNTVRYYAAFYHHWLHGGLWGCVLNQLTVIGKYILLLNTVIFMVFAVNWPAVETCQTAEDCDHTLLVQRPSTAHMSFFAACLAITFTTVCACMLAYECLMLVKVAIQQNEVHNMLSDTFSLPFRTPLHESLQSETVRSTVLRVVSAVPYYGPGLADAVLHFAHPNRDGKSQQQRSQQRRPNDDDSDDDVNATNHHRPQKKTTGGAARRHGSDRLDDDDVELNTARQYNAKRKEANRQASDDANRAKSDDGLILFEGLTWQAFLHVVCTRIFDVNAAPGDPPIAPHEYCHIYGVTNPAIVSQTMLHTENYRVALTAKGFFRGVATTISKVAIGQQPTTGPGRTTAGRRGSVDRDDDSDRAGFLSRQPREREQARGSVAPDAAGNDNDDTVTLTYLAYIEESLINRLIEAHFNAITHELRSYNDVRDVLVYDFSLRTTPVLLIVYYPLWALWATLKFVIRNVAAARASPASLFALNMTSTSRWQYRLFNETHHTWEARMHAATKQVTELVEKSTRMPVYGQLLTRFAQIIIVCVLVFSVINPVLVTAGNFLGSSLVVWVAVAVALFNAFDPLKFAVDREATHLNEGILKVIQQLCACHAGFADPRVSEFQRCASSTLLRYRILEALYEFVDMLATPIVIFLLLKTKAGEVELRALYDAIHSMTVYREPLGSVCKYSDVETQLHTSLMWAAVADPRHRLVEDGEGEGGAVGGGVNGEPVQPDATTHSATHLYDDAIAASGARPPQPPRVPTIPSIRSMTGSLDGGVYGSVAPAATHPSVPPLSFGGAPRATAAMPAALAALPTPRIPHTIQTDNDDPLKSTATLGGAAPRHDGGQETTTTAVGESEVASAAAPRHHVPPMEGRNISTDDDPSLWAAPAHSNEAAPHNDIIHSGGQQHQQNRGTTPFVAPYEPPMWQPIVPWFDAAADLSRGDPHDLFLRLKGQVSLALLLGVHKDWRLHIVSLGESTMSGFIDPPPPLRTCTSAAATPRSDVFDNEAPSYVGSDAHRGRGSRLGRNDDDRFSGSSDNGEDDLDRSSVFQPWWLYHKATLVTGWLGETSREEVEVFFDNVQPQTALVSNEVIDDATGETYLAPIASMRRWTGQQERFVSQRIMRDAALLKEEQEEHERRATQNDDDDHRRPTSARRGQEGPALHKAFMQLHLHPSTQDVYDALMRRFVSGGRETIRQPDPFGLGVNTAFTFGPQAPPPPSSVVLVPHAPITSGDSALRSTTNFATYPSQSAAAASRQASYIDSSVWYGGSYVAAAAPPVAGPARVPRLPIPGTGVPPSAVTAAATSNSGDDLRNPVFLRSSATASTSVVGGTTSQHLPVKPPGPSVVLPTRHVAPRDALTSAISASAAAAAAPVAAAASATAVDEEEFDAHNVFQSAVSYDAGALHSTTGSRAGPTRGGDMPPRQHSVVSPDSFRSFPPSAMTSVVALQNPGTFAGPNVWH